ncbi:AAA family ATPase [Sphingopyxis sp. C-1]|uniref:AAA family ATPase n=1 Tax=Sphingopyxis sp. C-1 TaxID=262667 RepID=UPI000ABE4771|nr:AAA family ATPase [Sphingopyxis sp. C-1]
MSDPSAKRPVPSLKKKNPLLRFTLKGQAAKLEEMAIEQKPLLGSFCLTGQGTVLCAPPNAGKTLITLAMLIEAIEAGRIAGSDVFYVDADDTTQGVADKVRVLDEYGVHVVAEGYQGFKARLLTPAIEEMIQEETAHGKLIILDTFKKFTQPMSKSETSGFTEVIRRFVLAGGALLALAHTNKHTDANGKNVFAGVSDIIDDLDCAYVIDVQDGRDGNRIAQLTNKKRRGNVPDKLAYAYSPDPELTYIQRLTSVHETDGYDGGADDVLDYKTPDNEILQTLALTIHHGGETGKMEIVRSVAAQDKVSKRRVLKLLERYVGEDPQKHYWRYVVRARGIHVFELIRPIDELVELLSSPRSAG